MKLMILDGNSIVNRAFYGVRMLTTADGTYTNAVYGFLMILQKLLSEEEPDAVCAAFDLKAPTFRHRLYSEYKGTRKGMPDELAAQMPILKEVLSAMNIPCYELEGYEADDIIGTVAAKCTESGWKCVAATGDRDSLQLINDYTSVKLVSTRSGITQSKLYDTAAFIEEYGFEPKYLVDLKALMGDSSDNIPGVAGVGEKTAKDLMQTYGSLEKVYESLEQIKPATAKKLAAGREAADMSYELATICAQVPMSFAPEDAMRAEPDNDRLYEIFRRLEFSRLIDKWKLTPPEKQVEKTGVSYERINICDEPEFEAAAEKLEAADIAAFYGESDIFCLFDGKTAYVFSREKWQGDWKGLKSRIFGAKIRKAAHGLKDILRELRAEKLPDGGWEFDIELAAYLLEPTAGNYSIMRLAQANGISLPEGTENVQMSLMSDMGEEFASCAAAVHFLKTALENQLKDNQLDRLYFETELPLCSVLADMELEGFLVDREALAEFGRFLSGEAERLEESIYALAGEKFNINSPKQLGNILFEKLMLPAAKKTKTGYSTNIEVLEGLAGKHPIINEIIEYREMAKFKSTYADGLLKVIADDGRIHSRFNMTVTATGRLSSAEPNLQNIPVRSELGTEFRKMFIAKEGCVLVDADYSQIELRVLAHISGDENMRSAFLAGADFHTMTASQVFGVAPEDVTPTMRSNAKAVNFGIVYGISDFSLAKDIGVSRREAKEYIDRYLGKYCGVHEYMSAIVEQGRRDGYVSTLFGRRRYLPELASSNYNIRSFGERVALNMPVQGTAADIIKLAMINTAKAFEKNGLKAKLLLQVHDELIAECPEEEKDEVMRLLTAEMENVIKLSVPLVAEAHCGKTWYEAK